MTIRLVTDSTCDLPQEAVKDHNITVIPLIITADSAEMRDGIDITRGEFYARLPGFRHSPKTAAPGPSVFRWNYERLASEGASDIRNAVPLAALNCGASPAFVLSMLRR